MSGGVVDRAQQVHPRPGVVVLDDGFPWLPLASLGLRGDKSANHRHRVYWPEWVGAAARRHLRLFGWNTWTKRLPATAVT